MIPNGVLARFRNNKLIETIVGKIYLQNGAFKKKIHNKNQNRMNQLVLLHEVRVSSFNPMDE